MAIFRKLKQTGGCGLSTRRMAAPSPLLATLATARPVLLSVPQLKKKKCQLCQLSAWRAQRSPPCQATGERLSRRRLQLLGGGFLRGTAIQQVVSLPGRGTNEKKPARSPASFFFLLSVNTIKSVCLFFVISQCYFHFCILPIT